MLRQVVEDRPILTVHGVVRWRSIDLLHWLWDEFRVAVLKQPLRRELRTTNCLRPRQCYLYRAATP